MAKYERFIDQLFDEENEQNIKIEDNDGKEIEFAQVAVVDFDANYYAILAPITHVEGVNEGEVMVFLIDEENDCLVFIDDDDVIDGVLEILESADEDEE